MKVFVRSITVAVLFFAVQAHAGDGSTVLSLDPEVEEAFVRQPSVKIYKYRNKSGVRSFSDQPPVDTRYEIIQVSCFACNLKSTVDWNSIPLQLTAFTSFINSAASKYRVDPALVRAIIHAESAFKARAKSRKGALGLMQLMPETAKEMGVKNALSPEENIRGGVRYLAKMLELHEGNSTLAMAAYNAGPGAVKRYNGIPPFEETQTYVKRVKILRERYRDAMLALASS